jgi:hypothetical protein
VRQPRPQRMLPSRRPRLFGLIAGLAAWLLVAPAAPPAAALPGAQTDQCTGQTDDSGRVYLGAWIPAALDDPRAPRSADPLGQFEARAGKGVSILQRWEHWGLDGGDTFDTKWLRRVAASGAYPMLTWVPWNPTIPEPAGQTGFLMRDIAAGKHDRYILGRAEEISEWDGPVFIRFAQEMNGTWYPWGKHQNSPEEFIAAWRHVHQLFAEHGAGHVTWVWNVSEKNHPESLSLWYPGDDVVDWVAVDGYNWDAPQYWQQNGNTWRLLDQVFRPSFDDINRFVPADKPRMIAETATNERADDPGKKADWICDAYGRALPQALPEVKAVMWFDEPTNEGGWVVPWPIDSSEQARDAFRQAVAPDHYVGPLGEQAMQRGRQKIAAP